MKGLAWSPSPSVSFQPSGCISMTLAHLSAHFLPTYCQRLRQSERVRGCLKAAQLTNAEVLFNQYDPGLSCSPGAEQSRSRSCNGDRLVSCCCCSHNPPPHLFAPLAIAGGTYAKTHCCKFCEPLRRLCVCVFAQARKQLRFFFPLVLELVASL